MLLTPEQSLEKIGDLAKAMGLSAEGLIVQSQNFKTSFQNQIINSYDVSKTCSLGIRVIDGDHEGLAYTESFQSTDIEATFNEALLNKNFVTKNYQQEFPQNKSIIGNQDFYNSQLSEVPVEKKLALAKELESYAKELDSRVHSLPYSSYGDIDTQIWLYNTRGTHSSYRTNACYAYAYPLCVEGEKRGGVFSVEATRDFSQLNPHRIIKKGVEEGLLKLSDQKPKSGKYQTVLHSKAAQTLISLLINHLSLKAVDQNLSALANKLGDQIFSDKFNLMDDPFYREGMNSRPFDAEGTLSQPVNIVEQGVLKTYFTNFNLAKKYNLKNTGHATRSPKSGLSISPTNLIVEPGQLSFNELVNLESEILVVDNLKGLAGVNPISGDFSIESEGMMYKQGKFTHAVSNFTLSGNIFECLKNIKELANDVDPSLESIYTPSLFLGEMSVAGV